MTRKFYVDECLDGPKFTNLLIESEIKILRQREVFEQGVPDEEWMAYTVEEGYYGLTNDNRISMGIQRVLALSLGAGIFVVRSTSPEMKHRELGNLVIEQMSAILEFIDKNNRPFIAKIRQTGVTGERLKDRVWE